ncbi:DUF1427 family protein [Roseovarius sp.]|uniref:DUF1427 family protein n=1 Tax=Roseovarius sp. TaxID=1486281 RepID=UPI000C5E8978|nr:DUF1427 family protein [Roseovarius sp.]MAZ21057.1 hypothetical protein [Roseovarius sp.]|tara:strand:+ start:333 stop:578 length:246 start_codon:yes stop_codon:yes gene_type:complete
MTWQPYLISLAAGLGIGVIYGLIAVRSPAPPIIALLGLLGMLASEAAVQWLRGHSQPIAQALHLKSFAISTDSEVNHDNKT